MVNGDGGATPVSAQGDDIRCRKRLLYVVAQQYVVFIGFTGHTPVGGDVDKYPFVLCKTAGDSLSTQRLPSDPTAPAFLLAWTGDKHDAPATRFGEPRGEHYRWRSVGPHGYQQQPDDQHHVECDDG